MKTLIKRGGFSLLELLICICILTIIASLTLPVIQRAYNKSKQNIRKIEAKNKLKMDTFLYDTESADFGIKVFMLEQERQILVGELAN